LRRNTYECGEEHDAPWESEGGEDSDAQAEHGDEQDGPEHGAFRAHRKRRGRGKAKAVEKSRQRQLWRDHKTEKLSVEVVFKENGEPEVRAAGTALFEELVDSGDLHTLVAGRVTSSVQVEQAWRASSMSSPLRPQELSLEMKGEICAGVFKCFSVIK